VRKQEKWENKKTGTPAFAPVKPGKIKGLKDRVGKCEAKSIFNQLIYSIYTR